MKRIDAVMVLTVIVVFVLAAWPLVYPPQDWSRDVDAPSILRGLVAAGDSGGWQWWHGVWVQGEGWPFWRPVISQLWLWEWRGLGHSFDSWFWMTYLLHVGTLICLFGFVSRLARSRWAGFGATLLVIVAQRPFMGAYFGWFPMQVSIASALLWIGALWAFTAGLDKSSRWLLVVSLALMFLALGARELSSAAIAAAVAIAWARRKVRAAWPMVVLGVVVSLWRLVVLPADALGSNLLHTHAQASVMARAAHRLLGPMAMPFIAPLAGRAMIWEQLWPVATGILVTVGVVLYSVASAQNKPKTAVAVAAGGVAISLLAARFCFGFAGAVLCAQPWEWAWQTTMLTMTLFVIWKTTRREGAAVTAMILVFFVPTMRRWGIPNGQAPISYHAYEWTLLNSVLFGLAMGAVATYARPKAWVWWVAAAVLVMPIVPALPPLPWWADNALRLWIEPLAVVMLLSRAIDQHRIATEGVAVRSVVPLREQGRWGWRRMLYDARDGGIPGK